MGRMFKCLDKRSGNTYVYEDWSYWDNEEKKRHIVRKLRGKIDPETGKMVPTDGRGKRRGFRRSIDMEGLSVSQIRFYGAAKLLDELMERYGFVEAIKSGAARSTDLFLSFVYYYVIEQADSVNQISKWSMTHMHPLMGPIGAEEIRSLGKALTKAKRAKIKASLEEKGFSAKNISEETEGMEFVKSCARSFDFYLMDRITELHEVITYQEIMEQLDLLGAVYKNAEEFMVGTVSERQKEIFRMFDVEPPENVCEYDDSDPVVPEKKKKSKEAKNEE